MGEDQINSILGEIVEGGTGRNDVAEEGMILFDPGLLGRGMRITEEEGRFLAAIAIIFKREHIRELAAVVGEDNGKQRTKGDVFFQQAHLEIVNGSSRQYAR